MPVLVPPIMQVIALLLRHAEEHPGEAGQVMRLTRTVAERQVATQEAIDYLAARGLLRETPELAYADFFEIARRGGQVRWYPSEIIEVLEVVDDRNVFGTMLDTTTALPITSTRHLIKRRPSYHCWDLTPKRVDPPAPEAPRPVAWARLRT